MNDTVITRSEHEASLRARYRAATLALRTPGWKYLGLVVAFLGVQILLFSIANHPAIALTLSMGCLIGCVALARLYRLHDREIRVRAALTPIYRLVAFRGQVDALKAAKGILRQAAVNGEPTQLRSALAAMRGALDRLISQSVASAVQEAALTDGERRAIIETDGSGLHLDEIDRAYLLLDRMANEGGFAEQVAIIAYRCHAHLDALASKVATPVPQA